MKYARFERIVVLVITIAIAVMAAAMLVQKTDGVEVFGHVLMLVVIVCSLYWGKRGALISFSACFLSYAAARLIWVGDFGYGTAVQLIVAKFLVYGILALLCSYMRTQFRYFFVKLERQDLIDDETQIGNERFLVQELTSRIDENDRYAIPFSLLEFSLDEDFVSGMRSKGVSVMRDLSTSVLKSDTRSVDELARAKSDFMVILPSVGRAGAEVCGRRLEEKMRKYLEHNSGDADAATLLSVSIFEYPEDKAEVDAILGRYEVD
ncbi:MAG: GGDEF domain-containing protein [Actinomycetota bacterium]